MKKLILIILALSLLLSLGACGEKEESAELDAAALADALLKGNVFSVSLEELNPGKLTAFYGVSEEAVEQALLYHAAGTSKEQIVLLRAKDANAAAETAAVLKALVAEWIRADTDYAPQEVPKLEKAVLRQSGAWVVLVVANDPDAAAKLVGEYI